MNLKQCICRSSPPNLGCWATRKESAGRPDPAEGVPSTLRFLSFPRLPVLLPPPATFPSHPELHVPQSPPSSYSSKTSFRARQSPACSVSGEALVLAFIREEKKKKNNHHHQPKLPFPKRKETARAFRARRRAPEREAGRRVTAPRIASPAPARRPRPAPDPAARATPALGPAPALYLVTGGRWRSGRRERRWGLAAGSGAQEGRSRRHHRHLGRRPTRPPHPALRTMGLGTRGGLSFFILGALLVLALLKAAVDSEESAGKWPRGSPAGAPGGSALLSGSFQLGIWW